MKQTVASGNMLGLGWLLAALGMCFCLACSQQTYQKPEKSALGYYYQAEQHMQLGNYAAALSALDSAIALNPRLTNLYRAKGWVLEKLNQPAAAIAAYRIFLQQRSGQPDIWLRLGELYAQTGDYPQAGFFLKKVSEVFPDSAEIQFRLGQIHIQMNAYARGLKYFEAYEKLSPRPVPDFWKWKGRALLQTGNFAAAAAALAKYGTTAPEDAQALKWLAVAKFELGNYDEALSLFNRAENQLKTDPEVYWYRARYFLKFGKTGVAREQLQFALAADSSVAAIWFELGQLDYREGQFALAKKRLNRVLRIDEKFWPAFRLLGFLAEQEGEFDLAKRYYQHYLTHAADRDREVAERLEALTTRKK